MTITKIKSIDYLEIELPVDKGLYAITGQNGAGKSTVVTCASSIFYNKDMDVFLGNTYPESSIVFEYNGSRKIFTKKDTNWKISKCGNIELYGFYEGSLMFGNRFRNTNYGIPKLLRRISTSRLQPASDFIRDNLGLILHDNKDFYEKLYYFDPRAIENAKQFYGHVFYYSIKDRLVGQFHMSTGENLLISILHSLYIRNSDRTALDTPCVLLLDEIEMALHPSSLKRLVLFLKDISAKFNYAIYFSTHSLEIISSISPENIYFLNRHSDHSLEVHNPCYPAYATRILYDHSGYDYVILVEDDLAKKIIDVLLRRNSLLGGKLVHVLPCGGYANVINLAQEAISSNLVGKMANISIILDADVKLQAENHIAKNGISNNIPLNYLPIESLEKYLKSKLFDSVDHRLFRLLNDFIFHQVSLDQILNEYRNSKECIKDKNGKKLYGLIDKELRARKKSRNEIIEMIVQYLIENDISAIMPISNFLRKQLE